MIFWTYRSALNETVIFSYLTDVSGSENAAAFDKFMNIPGNTTYDVGMTNMSELALGSQADGYRYVSPSKKRNVDSSS